VAFAAAAGYGVGSKEGQTRLYWAGHRRGLPARSSADSMRLCRKQSAGPRRCGTFRHRPSSAGVIQELRGPLRVVLVLLWFMRSRIWKRRQRRRDRRVRGSRLPSCSVSTMSCLSRRTRSPAAPVSPPPTVRSCRGLRDEVASPLRDRKERSASRSPRLTDLWRAVRVSSWAPAGNTSSLTREQSGDHDVRVTVVVDQDAVALGRPRNVLSKARPSSWLPSTQFPT
jgi:hypothetical protein